ncbi:MAG TPA: hypothetical protein VNU01_01100 [Egibacteraceae bacterium]|nr:hypothetical protein [Egibacteraceae bacterium]
MHRTRFHSLALPAPVRAEVRSRLRRAHAGRPFSALDPRDTVRRVAGIAGELGLTATVYRGVVDLRGAEVDHVWLDLHGRVVDAAFPLLEREFVELLRRFVAGDLEPHEIAEAAAGFALDARVLGEFPEPIRYLGRPVWSTRRALEPPGSHRNS